MSRKFSTAVARFVLRRSATETGTGFISVFFDTLGIRLTLGGVPALLLAAYAVKSLPVETVRWV